MKFNNINWSKKEIEDITTHALKNYMSAKNGKPKMTVLLCTSKVIDVPSNSSKSPMDSSDKEYSPEGY